jgi:hypothetical protein
LASILEFTQHPVSRGWVAHRLRESLCRDMAGWRGNLAKRRTRFEQWLEQAVHEEMVRASGQGRDFLADHLMEAQASLQRKVRGFPDRLAKAIEQALSLTFEGARFHPELTGPRYPDVRIGKVFDIQVDLLWLLIPMGVLGPWFERHFLGLVPWEAENDLSRLSNQWAEAANACIDGPVSEAMALMRQERKALEALTAVVEGPREEIQQALGALGGFSIDS